MLLIASKLIVIEREALWRKREVDPGKIRKMFSIPTEWFRQHMAQRRVWLSADINVSCLSLVHKNAFYDRVLEVWKWTINCFIRTRRMWRGGKSASEVSDLVLIIEWNDWLCMLPRAFTWWGDLEKDISVGEWRNAAKNPHRFMLRNFTNGGISRHLRSIVSWGDYARSHQIFVLWKLSHSFVSCCCSKELKRISSL